MRTVVLRNDFHKTSARVRPGPDGRVSPRATRRALADLCHICDCYCGRLRGPQEVHVGDAWDSDGNAFWVITEK